MAISLSDYREPQNYRFQINKEFDPRADAYNWNVNRWGDNDRSSFNGFYGQNAVFHPFAVLEWYNTRRVFVKHIERHGAHPTRMHIDYLTSRGTALQTVEMINLEACGHGPTFHHWSMMKPEDHAGIEKAIVDAIRSHGYSIGCKLLAVRKGISGNCHFLMAKNDGSKAMHMHAEYVGPQIELKKKANPGIFFDASGADRGISLVSRAVEDILRGELVVRRDGRGVISGRAASTFIVNDYVPHDAQRRQFDKWFRENPEQAKLITSEPGHFNACFNHEGLLVDIRRQLPHEIKYRSAMLPHGYDHELKVKEDQVMSLIQGKSSLQVKVVFNQSGGSQASGYNKEYSYMLLPKHISEVKKDDLLVVLAPNGYAVVQAVEDSFVGVVDKATKFIVDKVDLEGYKAELDRIKKVDELKNKLLEVKKSQSELEMFETLAANNPAAKELLDELKGLLA